MRTFSFLLAVTLCACSSAGTNSTSDPSSSVNGSTQPDPGSSPALVPAPSPALKLSSFKVHDGKGNSGPFKLDDLRRLSMDSAFRAAPGSHAQQIDIVNPHGQLYGHVRGKVVVGADGSAVASQGLEVAGTSIEQFHVVGTWQFVLSVDGTPLASTAVDIVE